METSIFILCLVSLIGWNTYRRDLSFWSGFFYLTFALWIASMLALPSENKLIHCSVDLIMLGLIPALFSKFLKGKPLWLISSLVPIFVAHMVFVSIIGHQDVEITNLDPHGEILIEITEPGNLVNIKMQLGKDLLHIEKAFNPLTMGRLDQYYVLDLKNSSLVHANSIINKLSGLNFVTHVEFNELYHVDAPALIPQKSHKITPYTNDPELNKQWHLEQLKARDVHQFIFTHKPKKNVVLAILDTGIDADHEDLQGRFQSTNEDYDNDDVGHGTHCAGIAAAISNNQVGIASMIPSMEYISITSIKVLKRGGTGSQKDIIAGIIKATDTGADVISLSLGGISSDSRQEAYKLAFEYASEKNVISVVAAGNNGGNAKYITPANVPGVITVAATNETMRLANFSNYLTDVDLGIAAPGVNIYSTIPNNKYTSFNGTSMATPMVAGVIAILRSYDPNLTTQKAYTLLHETGLSFGEDHKNGRLIQPFAALQQLEAIDMVY